MKSIIIIIMFMFIVLNVNAQFNSSVAQTSLLTTFVAIPVAVQPEHQTASFSIPQQLIELPFYGVYDGSNKWIFNISGEPGKTIHVEFFDPVTESLDAPILTGDWYDNIGVINTASKNYSLDETVFAFDVWYQLDQIDASNATIGNKIFVVKIIYSYLL